MFSYIHDITILNYDGKLNQRMNRHWLKSNYSVSFNYCMLYVFAFSISPKVVLFTSFLGFDSKVLLQSRFVLMRISVVGDLISKKSDNILYVFSKTLSDLLTLFVIVFVRNPSSICPSACDVCYTFRRYCFGYDGNPILKEIM